MVRGRKPAWWLLYALLPAAIGLLAVAHLASASDGWREVAEGIASMMSLGLMALWVRANRSALALGDEGQVLEEKMVDNQEHAWTGRDYLEATEEEANSRHGILHG